MFRMISYLIFCSLLRDINIGMLLSPIRACPRPEDGSQEQIFGINVPKRTHFTP